MQIREYEDYLNRRHAVCNSKEEDLDVLQNVSELFVWWRCCLSLFIVVVVVCTIREGG